MEAGLDSLGAVEMRNSLASRFGLQNLPATLTYDFPTISALASYIAGKWDSLSNEILLKLQNRFVCGFCEVFHMEEHTYHVQLGA